MIPRSPQNFVVAFTPKFFDALVADSVQYEFYINIHGSIFFVVYTFFFPNFSDLDGQGASGRGEGEQK